MIRAYQQRKDPGMNDFTDRGKYLHNSQVRDEDIPAPSSSGRGGRSPISLEKTEISYKRAAGNSGDGFGIKADAANFDASELDRQIAAESEALEAVIRNETAMMEA